MLIESTRRKTTHPPPRIPGLLLGIANPDATLSAAAQKVLELDAPPDQLIVGFPLDAVPDDKFDKAARETVLAVSKMASLEVAKNAPQYVKTGVDVFWLAVNCAQLCSQWRDHRRDIPALIVDTATLAFSTLTVGSQLTGWKQDVLLGDRLQDNMGVIFTAANAAAGNQEISMALLEQTVSASDQGTMFSLARPMLDAALSPDPQHSQVTLRALPHYDTAFSPKVTTTGGE